MDHRNPNRIFFDCCHRNLLLTGTHRYIEIYDKAMVFYPVIFKDEVMAFSPAIAPACDGYRNRNPIPKNNCFIAIIFGPLQLGWSVAASNHLY